MGWSAGVRGAPWRGRKQVEVRGGLLLQFLRPSSREAAGWDDAGARARVLAGGRDGVGRTGSHGGVAQR
jgi:hypothetical protein